MAEKAHELVPNDPQSVGENDIVFDCKHCNKSLVIDRVAAGHNLDCPTCGKSVTVPEVHKVVSLAEAPETEKLKSKPAWEQELVSIDSALKESKNQREEAGNFYKHHCSEANRQKLRIDKLDVKLKELETRKAQIQKEHPSQ
jgi:hypothetical protein